VLRQSYANPGVANAADDFLRFDQVDNVLYIHRELYGSLAGLQGVGWNRNGMAAAGQHEVTERLCNLRHLRIRDDLTLVTAGMDSPIDEDRQIFGKAQSLVTAVCHEYPGGLH
jgi:hypothetical protein